jgi:MFS transporter, UMF1 family
MVPRNDVRPPPAPRLWSRLSTISKRSFRSFTSSIEADDERSSSSDDDDEDDAAGSMSPSISSSDMHNGAPPKYPGEDTRPTSYKELAGWYMYAFAAETYVICGQCWAFSSRLLLGFDLLTIC